MTSSRINGTCNVLVVEDDELSQTIIELSLRKFGFSCEFAQTGEKALGLIGNKNYDLIFLDIGLPGINGIEVCRRIRALRDRSQPAIVMLTAHSHLKIRSESVEAGANNFITKPIGAKELGSLLKEYLEDGGGIYS